MSRTLLISLGSRLMSVSWPCRHSIIYRTCSSCIVSEAGRWQRESTMASFCCSKHTIFLLCTIQNQCKGQEEEFALPSTSTRSLSSSKSTSHQKINKWGSENLVVSHLGQLWKATLFTHLWCIISGVRLQEKVEIHHSWEQKGWNWHLLCMLKYWGV